MSISGNLSRDRVITELQKIKELKRGKKYLQAFNMLEDLQRYSKIQFPDLLQKIFPKLISLSNFLYKQNLSLSFLEHSESAIQIYFSQSKTPSLSEKSFFQILHTFNSKADQLRLCRNNSQAYSYYSKCFNVQIPAEKLGILILGALCKIHLNFSSLTTELKKHKETVHHAKEALLLLKQELKLRTLKTEEKTVNEWFSEMISGSTLAFLLIAVAQEALGNEKMKKEALEKAFEINLSQVGQKNEISAVLSKMRNEKKCGKILKSFHLDLEQLISSLQFPEQKKNKNIEARVAGRYYSKTQLQEKQKFLEDQPRLSFVSADEYFFKEISKNINIANDKLHLKPSFFIDNRAWTLVENKEKRKITDLRLKKRNTIFRIHNEKPSLHEKIKALTITCKESFQEQSLKLKKVFSTSESKQLVHKLCGRGKKKDFPNQRLFFKPPGPVTSFYSFSGEKVDSEKQLRILQDTKDEIEELMDSVSNEIHKLYTQASSVVNSPFLAKNCYENSLGRSASRNLKSPEMKIKILKNSIKDSLKHVKNKTETRMSTLSDFNFPSL